MSGSLIELAEEVKGEVEKLISNTDWDPTGVPIGEYKSVIELKSMLINTSKKCSKLIKKFG